MFRWYFESFRNKDRLTADFIRVRGPRNGQEQFLDPSATSMLQTFDYHLLGKELSESIYLKTIDSMLQTWWEHVECKSRQLVRYSPPHVFSPLDNLLCLRQHLAPNYLEWLSNRTRIASVSSMYPAQALVPYLQIGSIQPPS